MQNLWKSFTGKIILLYFTMYTKTRTKVVHKNVSQGWNKVRRSLSKLLHNIKVTGHVWFMEKLCLYDISIHTNLFLNRSINDVIKYFLHKSGLIWLWMQLFSAILASFLKKVLLKVKLYFLMVLFGTNWATPYSILNLYFLA